MNTNVTPPANASPSPEQPNLDRVRRRFRGPQNGRVIHSPLWSLIVVTDPENAKVEWLQLSAGVSYGTADRAICAARPLGWKLRQWLQQPQQERWLARHGYTYDRLMQEHNEAVKRNEDRKTEQYIEKIRGVNPSAQPSLA